MVVGSPPPGIPLRSMPGFVRAFAGALLVVLAPLRPPRIRRALSDVASAPCVRCTGVGWLSFSRHFAALHAGLRTSVRWRASGRPRCASSSTHTSGSVFRCVGSWRCVRLGQVKVNGASGGHRLQTDRGCVVGLRFVLLGGLLPVGDLSLSGTLRADQEPGGGASGGGLVWWWG